MYNTCNTISARFIDENREMNNGTDINNIYNHIFSVTKRWINEPGCQVEGYGQEI